MEVKLVVLEGKHKDQQIPLPDTIFLIGRDKQCHLRPHCPGVSRVHCAIAPWAGKVRVRDMKSRNGTYLNGRRVMGEIGAEDGDQLQVGTMVFSFHIKKADDTLPAAFRSDDRELEWLLVAPTDVPELASDSPTGVMPLPQVEEETPKGISAGEHLRTYLKERRRRPRPPGGGAIPPARK